MMNHIKNEEIRISLNRQSKEQLSNVYMKQADFAYKKHNDRRNYEWKINLALWGIMMTAIIKPINIPEYLWIINIILYVCIWQRGLWVANENNKNWYDYFNNKAIEVYSNKNNIEILNLPHKLYPCEIQWWFGFMKSWSQVFTTVVTLALSLIGIFKLINR